MKILFISMPSIHFIRWVENLKDTDIELYWFDILDRGRIDEFNNVKQYVNWKKRKIPYIKGEYFLSKKAPVLYEKIKPFLEVRLNDALEEVLEEIKPDIVHSFEMQSCSYPILTIMKKHQEIKWLYSCWGSDLFFYKEIENHRKKIELVLNNITHLHTDCKRDYKLAKELGFLGEYVGLIPGGGGFENLDYISLEDSKKRKIILIKGYQHKFGRGLNVVKALEKLEDKLKKYEIIVFGSHQSVIDYVNENKLNFKCFSRGALNHDEIMKLMGKSLIYIGNSISDGMPNTLLEAILMGVFPIQSNPGGVTSEIIDNGKNGMLIEDANDVNHIKNIILEVINRKDLISNAVAINAKIAKKKLDYKTNKRKIINIYRKMINA